MFICRHIVETIPRLLQFLPQWPLPQASGECGLTCRWGSFFSPCSRAIHGPHGHLFYFAATTGTTWPQKHTFYPLRILINLFLLKWSLKIRQNVFWTTYSPRSLSKVLKIREPVWKLCKNFDAILDANWRSFNKSETLLCLGYERDAEDFCPNFTSENTNSVIIILAIIEAN